MNLDQGRITLEQIWQNPQARSFLVTQIPLLQKGLPSQYRSMTLKQAMAAGGRFLSQKKINYIYTRLEQL